MVATSQRLRSEFAGYAPITLGPSQNLQCISAPGQDKIYVASWTTRIGEGSIAHLRLVRVDADSVHVLQAIDLKDGLASELVFSGKWKEQESPLLAVLTRYGAEASEVRVMAVRSGFFHLVFRRLADDITIVNLAGKDLIVAHNNLNGIDVPALYEYNGATFMRVDAHYPNYYRELMRDQHLSADSTVAASVVTQLAKLIYLSGDVKGSERLLEQTKVR